MKARKKKGRVKPARAQKAQKGFPLSVLFGVVVLGLGIALAGVFLKERGHTKAARELAGAHAQEQGIIVSAASRKYELVFGAEKMTFYLLEESAGEGTSVTLSYAVGLQTESFELKQTAADKFEANRPSRLAPPVEVTASLRFPGMRPREIVFSSKR